MQSALEQHGGMCCSAVQYASFPLAQHPLAAPHWLLVPSPGRDASATIKRIKRNVAARVLCWTHPGRERRAATLRFGLLPPGDSTIVITITIITITISTIITIIITYMTSIYIIHPPGDHPLPPHLAGHARPAGPRPSPLASRQGWDKQLFGKGVTNSLHFAVACF